MNTTNKGSKCELATIALLEDDGWLCGSRRHHRKEPGSGDVTAQKPDVMGLLIECKESKGGPYENFRRADREALSATADRNGVRAVLAWRSAPSKPIRLVYEWDWPEVSRLHGMRQ